MLIFTIDWQPSAGKCVDTSHEIFTYKYCTLFIFLDILFNLQLRDQHQILLLIISVFKQASILLDIIRHYGFLDIMISWEDVN